MIKTIADYFQRTRSVRELSGLSDRELADLGIARVDIKAVVQQAQMNRDEVASVVTPRQTLGRLGGEKTVTTVESFA